MINTVMNDKGKIDIIKLLDDNIIKVKPKGYSMYPLIIPGRDYAIIEKSEFSSLKRSDVVLYRRDDQTLVLHRIYKIKNNNVYTVGDNQTEIEGPLRMDQIKGKMIAIVRNGHEITTDNILYRMITGLWLLLRPLRRPISLLGSKIRRLLQR